MLHRQRPHQGKGQVSILLDGAEESPRLSRRLRWPAANLDWVEDMVRSRSRWRDTADSEGVVRKRCADALALLGLSSDSLPELASAGSVQLTIPRDAPRDVMVFPWEFVISEATRLLRQDGAGGRRPLFVFRHVPNEAPRVAPATVRPDEDVPRTMIVESAPGRLGDVYEFENERRLVLLSLGAHESGETVLVNPDLATLAKEVAEQSPEVVHLTGIDSFQGAQLLNQTPPPSAKDGLYLPGPGGFPEVAGFDRLIPALVAPAPALIAINAYNSSRGAHLAVAQGAGAAIGFHDTVDDAIAEEFFSAYYTEWRRSGRNAIEAFRRTWPKLAGRTLLRGTGIVLVTATPVRVAGLAPTLTFRVPPTDADQRKPAPAEPTLDPATTLDYAERIGVEVKCSKLLNYSLLHNNWPLFETFVIRRLKPGRYAGLKVEVVLNAGDQSPRFQAVYSLSEDQAVINTLRDDVRVSLTSALARSIVESVYTSVSVCVTWGPHVLYEITNRVEMLPCDEWLDDDLNRKWLPSFVHPRDPAVRKVVDDAQRYLIALADDADAGFDGYQSTDLSAASLEDRHSGVDAQVRAIWWTLIHDYRLAYVNPPPTFTERSQRLRTPGDVISGRRGTCIDLTLLLAACLEYVDIQPLVFLLTGHAFPGYVRSEEGRKELAQLYIESTGSAPANQGSWTIGKEQWSTVTRLVQQGHVVPLESTLLSERRGFAEAVAEGMQNLRSHREFQVLLDVHRARSAKVTPIPLWSRT